MNTFAFWRLFRRPTLAEELRRQLNEAELDLLAAESASEMYRCHVLALRERVSRLRGRAVLLEEAKQ